MTSCPHQSQPPGKDTGRRLCALGLFGGKPFSGNCLSCIAKGRNNAEYAAALFARHEKTHPGDKPRVSGCCDSARNY